MDEDDMPHFNSKEEEIKYWKDTARHLKVKVDELEKELIEFQDSSSQLEKELEKSLEHADKTNRDLKTKCNRLTLDLDTCREKYEQQCHQSSKQINDLQKEISEYVQNEERLIKYIRDLEQKNDDLERSERVMLETVGDIEAKLNSAIERNALLENELDEKETLRAMVQRLKDEHRDMQQELNRQRWQGIPDNNKVIERVRSPVELNKLSLDNQSPTTQMKSKKNKILKHNIAAEDKCKYLYRECKPSHHSSVQKFSKSEWNNKRNFSAMTNEAVNKKNFKREDNDKCMFKRNNIEITKYACNKRKFTNSNQKETSIGNKYDFGGKKTGLIEKEQKRVSRLKSPFSFKKMLSLK
ncbi:hypothetical protein RUM44_011020 [Polyplax serrata]|uniref:NUDE domain-containing protein n=1 Tax=Polyplax serrata TaxID=468196 RepID=A0ABR1ANU2_POLSC